MRDFYQHQDDAHGMTKSLCLLLGFSVVSTVAVSAAALAGVAVAATYGHLSVTTEIEMPVAYWQTTFLERFVQALVLSTITVAGVAIYKSLQLLEEGGRSVAKSLGGSRVLDGAEDPEHRKLLHVVEEVAIAANLRRLPVYVLEGETGINAFAAGFDAKDTVIGITRGALSRLKRHQLQGIVAHEYGHVAKQDTRLNIRLIGILAGIQSLTYVSQYLLRIAMNPSKDARGAATSGKNPLGMALSLAFGMALWPIGQVGSLFARLICASVNRQREFLADACAVQYTRDADGLCEALQVVRDDEVGSRMEGAASQLASHMFFSNVWTTPWLLHTHPPLEERIRRLKSSSSAIEGPVETSPVMSVTSG